MDMEHTIFFSLYQLEVNKVTVFEINGMSPVLLIEKGISQLVLRFLGELKSEIDE